MSKLNITAERLREVLHYDPMTGIFTARITRRGSKARPGDVIAGSLAPNGYLFIGVDYGHYLAHRLAWLYVYGEWPKHRIDHINRVRSDNWIDNLRDATPVLNALNVVRANKSNKLGVLGVIQRGSRFTAQVSVGIGKNKSLGSFATIEEASAAYQAAKLARTPDAVLVPG